MLVESGQESLKSETLFLCLYCIRIHNTNTMKRVAAIFFLTTIICMAQAQNAKRFWNDGPLVSTDFRQADTVSHLSWYLGYTKVTEKDDNIHYTYYKAVAYMLPYSSSLAVEDDLRKMQVLFDRLEVHRREMQQLLNEAESRDEFEDLLADSRRRMAYDEHHPSESTSAPELPTSTIPVFTDQSFHFGVSAGTPLSVPTGTLAKFTGVAVGLSPAIEIGWNSSHIMTDLSLLWGTLTGSKGDAPHRFLQGNKYSVLNAAFYYGHSIYETPHIRLMPYIGAGLGVLSSNTATDTANCIGINPQIGLTIDIPFYTHIITQSGNSGLFSFLQSNHSIYSIRAQVFLRRETWKEVANGFTIGFNLGVSFQGRNTNPARSL